MCLGLNPVLLRINPLTVGLHIPLGALRDDVVPNSDVIERNWTFWSLFCQVTSRISTATASLNARK